LRKHLKWNKSFTILAELLKGEKQYKIAEKLGISHQYVSQIVIEAKKNGIKIENEKDRSIRDRDKQ